MSAKRNETENVFTKIERILGQKFPKDIKKFLLSAGYDTASIISIITTEDIKIIENFVNSDLSILNDTTYKVPENGSQFKLKPGHKQFITKLPQIIKDYKNSLTKRGEFPSEKQLKEKLIKKVENFLSKISITVHLDNSCIGNLEKHPLKVTSKFACFVCNKKISVEFKSYWKISNLQKHLKDHHKKNEIGEETFIVVSEVNIEEQNQNIGINENANLNINISTLTNAPVHCYSEQQNDILNQLLAA